MEDFVVPLGVSIGSGFLLNRMGVPMLLNIPISGTAFVYILIEEKFRKTANYGPWTPYEWYVDFSLLGKSDKDIAANRRS